MTPQQSITHKDVMATYFDKGFQAGMATSELVVRHTPLATMTGERLTFRMWALGVLTAIFSQRSMIAVIEESYRDIVLERLKEEQES